MNTIFRSVLFIELFRQALDSLIDNRLRAVLSIIGVAIGVMSVIVVNSVSESGRAMIFSELETFGLRSVWVYRDYDDHPTNSSSSRFSGIDNDDLIVIENGCCPAIELISPRIFNPRVPLRASVGGVTARSKIEGVGEDFSIINNDRLTSGRNIKKEDILKRRSVAVIGPTLKSELFGDKREAVGRSIRINGIKFVVIGILKGKSRDFLASIGSAGGADANSRILLPYTTYQKLFAASHIDLLQLRVPTMEQAELAKSQVLSVLSRRHSEKYKYKSESMAEHVDTANRILKSITVVGIVAASVSLVVGALGIANIMSTSVLERTREIGLRMALGARRQDVLIQFLLEAIIIGALGGLIGLMFGGLFVLLITSVAGFSLYLSPLALVFALVISVGVGLLSGYFPALRAAKMQPVEALRSE